MSSCNNLFKGFIMNPDLLSYIKSLEMSNGRLAADRASLEMYADTLRKKINQYDELLDISDPNEIRDRIQKIREAGL